jgi:phosphatidate cytidylyltransferase
MAPPDETWVPEWEPKEETTPKMGRLSTVEEAQSDEVAVLDDDDLFDSATSQHQALAEEIMEANAKEHRQQAVAAAMPGVDSGILGFEDVTGRTGMATEEVEAAEQARSSDLVRRTVSAVALVAVVVMALYMGGAWLSGLIILVMVMGLVEFYVAVRSAGYRPIALIGLLGVLGAGVAAHISGLAAVGGVLAGAVGLILLFFVAAARRLSVENSTLTVFGMVWLSLLSYGVAIGRAEEGVVLLVWVLLVNAIFDTSAYVVGRAFGTRQLSPSLSEKKTVQGLVGGVLGAFALAAILSTLPQLSVLDLFSALWLAAVVSVLAPLGDAAESAVKRSMDIKDMSSFIPGHGGILDRVDGLLLVFPGSYYLFSLLELI